MYLALNARDTLKNVLIDAASSLGLRLGFNVFFYLLTLAIGNKVWCSLSAIPLAKRD